MYLLLMIQQQTHLANKRREWCGLKVHLDFSLCEKKPPQGENTTVQAYKLTRLGLEQMS